MCMIGIVGIALTSETFSNRFLEIKTSWESLKKEVILQFNVGERVHHIDASIRLIKESPWIGFGTGSYRSEHQRKLIHMTLQELSTLIIRIINFYKHPYNLELFGLIILLLLLPVLSSLQNLSKSQVS